MTRREAILGGLATAWGTMAVSEAEAETQNRAEGKRMKLGLISYNIARDWDLPTLIQHCQKAGFEGAELRTTHAHGVETTLTAAQRKEVKQRFADAGLTLWGLGTVCEFHYPDMAKVREQVESCKRWCALAQDIGATGVKVRPNGLPDSVPVEKTLAQIATALRECGEAAESHGVEIWLEVHGPGTAHPPHIRTILDQCHHSKVGACWNSNPQDILNGSVKTYFDLLRPDIKSCHINDLWSPAYPYRELFTLLQKSGYDRFTLCEVGTPIKPEDGVVFMHCYRGLWRELGRS